MNEEAGCFDPNSMVEGPDDGLSQVLQPPPIMAGSTTNSHNSFKENLKLSTEELSYHHSNPLQEEDVSAAMEIQLQNQQMVFNTHTTPLGFGGDLSMTDKLYESYKQLSATELQRRQQLIDKYRTLRDLIPHPMKPDRASVVGDAIEYIKELLQTVNVLKIRLDKKRCARERSKGHKTEEDSAGNNGHESSSIMNPLGHPDQSFNDGSLRLKGCGIIGNGKRGSNRTEKRLLSSVLEMVVVAVALALSNTRIADGIIMSAFLLIFLEYAGNCLFCLLKPCLLAFPPFIRGVFSYSRRLRRDSKKGWIIVEQDDSASDYCVLVESLESNSPV
ncbi:hypothetical protein GH714_004422 [Hevea brasiliensis]|uniref:BHLH domain-containing protein n=1 Tax=Hevea brasiliensis TaxID=3981 RepID=A0A6A6L229_HEVBR|nr:hypothetical protein GH714_004422 [Hevea brasiliensis]